VRPRTERTSGGRHNRFVETLAEKSPSPLLWLMTTAVTLSSAAGFAVLMAWMPSLIGASAEPAQPPAAIGAAAVPAEGLARHKSRCAECGWIESIRETEITVRLQDGSSRVIVDAHRGSSRIGERVMIIDGAE
jgi:hypothetical protein